MNLIFDISALGIWHKSPGGRRGIYRVVEETLRAMVKHTSPDLSSTDDPEAGLEYLELVGEPLRCLSFHGSERNRRVRQTIRKTLDLRSHGIGSTENDRSLSARIIRRFSCELVSRARLVDRFRECSRFSLDGIDLFHQPGRFPFPDFVRENKRPGFARLMTLYDFIPFHEAGLKASAGASYLSNVLGTLSQEDSLICISNYVKDEACERLRIPHDQLFVAQLAACPKTFYHCTDPFRINAARLEAGIGDAPYFLALTALDDRKNLPFLLEAFSRVCKQQPDFDVNLVLVGAGSHKTMQQLLSTAASLGVKDRIVLPGFVQDHLLAPLYSGAAGFLFPSLDEGFGLPPLEAMQCGLPVISSHRSSLPEVVGDSGILLDPLDGDAWASAILGLYSNSRLSSELRAKGIERAKAFSWDASARIHLDIYKTIHERMGKNS